MQVALLKKQYWSVLLGMSATHKAVACIYLANITTPAGVVNLAQAVYAASDPQIICR